MLVAAENATELPSDGNPRMKLSVTASHTRIVLRLKPRDMRICETGSPVRTGVLRLASTLWKNLEPGNAPSLEKAYIMREFDVIEKMPAKNMHMNITTYRN